MGDFTVSPLHPGLTAESEVHPMEAEGSGKKRPASPPGSGDEDLPKFTPGNVNDEWLASDTDGEDGDDHENQGTLGPYTIDDFPRVNSDFDEQNGVLFRDPNVALRGPSPIRLFPPFKGGRHPFGSDYNLSDKSEISISNVRDCSTQCHCISMCLIQFIDIKISGYRHTRPGPARIFGFIAAQDKIEPSRNYVYRRGIDNCEAVSVNRDTGTARLSLTSPTRVISMVSHALIEFELYIRAEDQSEDEPKGDCLIEGCTELTNLHSSESFVEHRRLYGESCALDVKFAALIGAMEARVDVEVLRLGPAAIAGGVNLKVYAKTSGFREVIKLYRGAAPEPGSVMSFVVAMETCNCLDLYIEGSPGDDQHPVLEQEGKKPMSYCRWKFGVGSDYHCSDEDVGELGEFGEVAVKITWKSYERNVFRESC